MSFAEVRLCFAADLQQWIKHAHDLEQLIAHAFLNSSKRIDAMDLCLPAKDTRKRKADCDDTTLMDELLDLSNWNQHIVKASSECPLLCKILRNATTNKQHNAAKGVQRGGAATLNNSKRSNIRNGRINYVSPM